MIDPKELRLGNLLKSETGEILPVAYIHEDVIGLRNTMGGVQKHQKNPIISYDIDKLEYVPLSEELLMRFGAIIYQGKWLIGNIELDYITTDEHFEFEYQTPNLDWEIVEIKYVHELQNLYYDLHKKQLILKP